MKFIIILKLIPEDGVSNISSFVSTLNISTHNLNTIVGYGIINGVK